MTEKEKVVDSFDERIKNLLTTYIDDCKAINGSFQASLINMIAGLSKGLSSNIAFVVWKQNPDTFEESLSIVQGLLKIVEIQTIKCIAEKKMGEVNKWR